tara:strand:- start:406 stop:717 length:312 start_codon:yes stop_codon:yes gene_type:complete
MEIEKIYFEKQELDHLDWISDKITIYNLKEANGVYLDATLALTEMLSFFDNQGQPVELSTLEEFDFKGKTFKIEKAEANEKFIQKVIFDSVNNQADMDEAGVN